MMNTKNSDTDIQQPQAVELSLSKMFLKTTLISLLIASLLLLITFILVFIFSWLKFNQFLSSANISQEEVFTIIENGWNNKPSLSDGKKNFLILGLDTIENRGDVPSLTDTILLLSINTNTGKISTLSLPRDLWNQDYQTKINALYHYGHEKYPEKPEQFTTEVVEDITNIPIHHTIILSLDQVEKIINIIGGIDVYVKDGFTDDEFPLADVDIKVEHDPDKLYETIVFTEGTENMDGERALKYIRSRHSGDDQGTDEARGKRQQIVVQSLAKSLMDYKLLLGNPELVGELFTFFKNNFNDQLPMSEIVSTLKLLHPVRENIEFEPHSISIETKNNKGVILHPTPSQQYQNQWVYIISDTELFQEEIQSKLMKN